MGSKAEIDRLTQFSLASPFGELHLGHQRWPDPRGDVFVLNFGGEGRSCGLQLDELAVEVLQHLMTEPGPHVADVAPGVPLPDREDERAEKRSGTPWSGEAGYHDFLPFGG